MSSPFIEPAERIISYANDLSEMEEFLKKRIPGVDWNFTMLNRLFLDMAEQVSAGLALKAWQRYEEFSVLSPGQLLGRRSSERKRAMARLIGAKGGAKKSHRKRAASRWNLAQARKMKSFRAAQQKKNEPPVKKEIRLLKKEWWRYELRIRRAKPGRYRDGLERRGLEIEKQIRALEISLERSRRVRLEPKVP